MEFLKRSWKILLIIILLLANIVVWMIVVGNKPKEYMTVAFLNIGQGDAIFVESPTGNQLLIDGGPAHKILGELRKVMPFYDREINYLIVTNPDADHYAGFIDVLRTYKVDTVLEPGTKSTTETYKVFEQDVHDEHAETLLAKRGMIIHLGSGADLRILYPDKDVSNYSPNNGSVVAQLTYGSSSIMFTGDAPSPVEEYVATLERGNIRSDILKVGHHGSRTSASESFIQAVSPAYAVISAGVNNRYGHPHKETIDLLNKLNITTLGTYTEGTIIFHCSLKECIRQ